MPDLPPQVMATLPALQLIETLQARHGDLLFHQSGGCCDGSSPMCFAQGDFIVGDRDVRMGEIGGAPFYISPAQFEYWKPQAHKFHHFISTALAVSPCKPQRQDDEAALVR